jgi:hypothetical protein
MNDETPYDELDPSIVSLVRAINALPGIWTIGSCGGHEEGGSLPSDLYEVMFQFEIDGDRRPTAEAWQAFEYLAWFADECGDLSLRVWADMGQAIVPWRRTRPEPGRTVMFELSGFREGGDEPDHRAYCLTDWYEDYLEALEES